MGYRSDVAYVLRFDNKADMDAFTALQLAKQDEHINDALKELRLIQSTSRARILFFYAENVKWYQGYSDVDSHEVLLKQAIEMFDTAGYRFVRIGENYDDVELKDEGDYDHLWDYIDVYRPTINSDVGNTTPIINDEGEVA